MIFFVVVNPEFDMFRSIVVDGVVIIDRNDNDDNDREW